jgi:hypothetical protein
MGNVLRVFARDMKRLAKTPAAWVVALALIVLPSLYAWINVYGFWNPYDNTQTLRVCVVNEDQGAHYDKLGDLDLGAQIVDDLRENDQMGWAFVDRDEAEDRRAAMIAAFEADVFLASANAITEDGIMVNIDGAANRIAALAFGPRKLVMIVGMNKVCPDVDTAIKRARNVAAPINAQRFGLTTPCSKTGACADCKSADSICCQMLITRFAMDENRVHVILVNDSLGF